MIDIKVALETPVGCTVGNSSSISHSTLILMYDTVSAG